MDVLASRGGFGDLLGGMFVDFGRLAIDGAFEGLSLLLEIVVRLKSLGNFASGKQTTYLACIVCACWFFGWDSQGRSSKEGKEHIGFDENHYEMMI